MSKIEVPGTAQKYLDATVSEDVGRLLQCYSASADICWFPGSPDWFVHGLDNVKKAWTDWFQAPPMHFRSWEWLDGPYGEQSGDLMWCWGILHAVYDTAEDPPTTGVPQDKRISWVFRREGAEWRIAAETWSRPRIDDYLTPDDPETLRYRPFGEE